MKILFLFIFTINTYAYFDLSFNASGRTYPSAGGEIGLESGYNQLLWGEGNPKNPLYGFIRPVIKLSSSGVINTAEGRLEFYPVSFLGFVKKYQTVKSDYDQFSFYDCDDVNCKGLIKRDSTIMKLALGAFGVIALGELEFSQNTYDVDKENQPMAEFRFAMLADSNDDDFYRSRYVFAIKHKSGLIGVASEYAKFSNSKQSYNMDLLIYTHTADRSNYTFGIGQFYSTHVAQGLIGVFQMKTNFMKSLALF